MWGVCHKLSNQDFDMFVLFSSRFGIWIFFPTHFLHFHSTFSKATSLPNTMSFLSYSAMLSFSSESQAESSEWQCRGENQVERESSTVKMSQLATFCKK